MPMSHPFTVFSFSFSFSLFFSLCQINTRNCFSFLAQLFFFLFQYLSFSRPSKFCNGLEAPPPRSWRIIIYSLFCPVTLKKLEKEIRSIFHITGGLELIRWKGFNHKFVELVFQKLLLYKINNIFLYVFMWKKWKSNKKKLII